MTGYEGVGPEKVSAPDGFCRGEGGTPPGAGVTTMWPRLQSQRDCGEMVPALSAVSKVFGALFVGGNDEGNERAVNRPERSCLEPRPDQDDIRGAGREQRNRQRELHAFVRGWQDRSHGLEHPAILGRESRGFFFWGFTSR